MLVASELQPVADALRSALSLGEPFHDPGVAEFGLVNAVFAIGDCFLEVIAPTRPNTAAGRYLDRHGGDAGYMVIFDLENLDDARARVGALGVRVVWQIDLPDISGTHLHPADTRGALVSIDSSRPYGSWRWGGPSWTARIGEAGPGRLRAITIAVADPAAVAARWGEILGIPVSDAEGPLLALEGASVRFERAEDANTEGLVEIAVEQPGDAAAAQVDEVGDVRLRRVAPGATEVNSAK